MTARKPLDARTEVAVLRRVARRYRSGADFWEQQGDIVEVVSEANVSRKVLDAKADVLRCEARNLEHEARRISRAAKGGKR
jgi:hypothetical protein